MQDNELKPGTSYSPARPASQQPAIGQNPDAVTRVEAPGAQIGALQVESPSEQEARLQPATMQPESQAFQIAHYATTPSQEMLDSQQMPGRTDDYDDVQDEEDEDEHEDPHTEVALLSWNAPEFTFTNKPGGWFMLLALFFAALIAVAVLTRQWLSIGLFALMGIALAVYANRKPRTLNYTITTHGVRVGEKAYAFDSFSSFYEVSDYGQQVFELVPAKRLGTLVSLPVQKEQQRTLEGLMGSVLPKVPARNDIIDRLFRYLRF